MIDRSAFGTTVEVNRGDILLVRPPMEAPNWQVEYSSAVLELQTPAAQASNPGPDGWRFRVAATGETDLSLVAIRVTGANPPRFTVTIKVQPQPNQVAVGEASLSPDGRTVAYTRVRNSPDGRTQPLGVNLVSFAGGQPTELLSSSSAVTGLGWSRDGARIGFASAGVLQSVAAAGGTIDRGASRSEYPTVASGPAQMLANGKQSVLMTKDGLTWIDLVDPSTGARVTVLRPGFATLAGPPSWSADGTRFVVVGSTREHPAEVFAGTLPLPNMTAPDWVGNVPPTVRRITFSNP